MKLLWNKTRVQIKGNVELLPLLLLPHSLRVRTPLSLRGCGPLFILYIARTHTHTHMCVFLVLVIAGIVMIYEYILHAHMGFCTTEDEEDDGNDDDDYFQKTKRQQFSFSLSILMRQTVAGEAYTTHMRQTRRRRLRRQTLRHHRELAV